MARRSDDGGSAFPIPAGGKDGYGNPTNPPRYGMTLHDYFAGQALAGLLANANLIDHLRPDDHPLTDDEFLASIAAGAGRYADAMIAERARK